MSTVKPPAPATPPPSAMAAQPPVIAVVIPSYRVRAHILDVVAAVPAEVTWIIVVDDACPEGSGALVRERCHDPRVRVHVNASNLGVGGAVMRGYAEAIALGADILVKVDGDGQMDPRLVPYFVGPIASGEADYTKGNRFFDLTNIRQMPPIRIFGNAVLSFMAKVSTGYWDLFDPTNGYTAIHADVASRLPVDRISPRYFFETDLLFRLNTLRAVAVDVPMDAQYGTETSNLRVSRVVGEFMVKHLRNLAKRIFYNYFLRDLSLASIELVLGTVLFTAGVVLGATAWAGALASGTQTTAGTVMLSALPIILGLQFLLAFVGYDIASIPRRCLHRNGPRVARAPGSAPAPDPDPDQAG